MIQERSRTLLYPKLKVFIFLLLCPFLFLSLHLFPFSLNFAFSQDLYPEPMNLEKDLQSDLYELPEAGDLEIGSDPLGLGLEGDDLHQASPSKPRISDSDSEKSSFSLMDSYRGFTVSLISTLDEVIPDMGDYIPAEKNVSFGNSEYERYFTLSLGYDWYYKKGSTFFGIHGFTSTKGENDNLTIRPMGLSGRAGLFYKTPNDYLLKLFGGIGIGNIFYEEPSYSYEFGDSVFSGGKVTSYVGPFYYLGFEFKIHEHFGVNWMYQRMTGRLRTEVSQYDNNVFVGLTRNDYDIETQQHLFGVNFYF